MTEHEPLLQPNPLRFVQLPIRFPDIHDMYKKAEASFWTAEEVDLSRDKADWDKLKESEQHFILQVLAFFAGSDGVVNENLALNFYGEIQIPEARNFLGMQIAMENIHGEVYGMLIVSYVPDEEQRNNLFSAIVTIPCVARKANWALRYINRDYATFCERLIAFAIVEGIFFSASFCAIFWLKKRGLMPGLCFSNEMISRDEGLHCEFACLLYRSHIVGKLTDEQVHRIVDEAVDIECQFVRESLPKDLVGMNADLMSCYVKCCANRLLTSLGHSKLYEDVQNPFDWMDLISVDGKTNFFEKRVGEYSLCGVGKSPSVSTAIRFTSDF